MQDLLCGVSSSSGRERSEAAQLRTMKDDDGNPPRKVMKAPFGLERFDSSDSKTSLGHGRRHQSD